MIAPFPQVDPIVNGIHLPLSIVMLQAFLLVAFALAAAWLYIVYQSLFCPLRKVPNAHWSAPFLPIWILWRRHQHTELPAVVAAHQKLGPIVRLGPRDLSISSYDDGVRTVYGGNYDKPAYYGDFNYYGQQNAFSSLSKADHSRSRRRIASVYSKTAVFNSVPLRQSTTSILRHDLLPLLDSHATDGSVLDVLQVSYALSLDLVNAFIFGGGRTTSFLKDPIATHAFLEKYEEKYCDESFWQQELPGLTKAVSWLGYSMVPTSKLAATIWLERWMMEMVESAEKFPVDENGRYPVVYSSARDCVDRELEGKSAEEKRTAIASELFDHMSSAREVLGLVLGYTMYYIARRPDSQARLREELFAAAPAECWSIGADNTTSHLPEPALLDRLPYMRAVLQESLRMRPNSTPLPRITPQDHAVSIAGVDNIPPGVRVNAFQWMLHRDPEKWASADHWEPERFLVGKSDSQTRPGEKEKNLWPFASGSRMCVGSHLAGYLMRYILAVFVVNFDFESVPDEEHGKHAPGSLHDRLLVKLRPASGKMDAK